MKNIKKCDKFIKKVDIYWFQFLTVILIDERLISKICNEEPHNF